MGMYLCVHLCGGGGTVHVYVRLVYDHVCASERVFKHLGLLVPKHVNAHTNNDL